MKEKAYLVVIIISHFSAPWQRDEVAQSSTWETPIDGVKMFHVFGCDSKKQEGESIIVGCEDNYENILQKTILALRYVEVNFEYKYLLRLNVSTYFDLNKFLSYLRLNFFTQNLAVGYFEQHKKKFNFQLPSQLYISGAAIALDRGAVKILTKLDWTNYKGVPDDVSITHFLWSRGIKLLHMPRCNYHITHLVLNMPYIRVKSSEEVSLTSIRMESIKSLLSQKRTFDRIIHFIKLIFIEINVSWTNRSFLQDFFLKPILHMWSRKKCTRAMIKEGIERSP
jgi:hypothetical protein